MTEETHHTYFALSRADHGGAREDLEIEWGRFLLTDGLRDGGILLADGPLDGDILSLDEREKNFLVGGSLSWVARLDEKHPSWDVQIEPLLS